eukprot:4547794-Amphidinium_carterae.1
MHIYRPQPSTAFAARRPTATSMPLNVVETKWRALVIKFMAAVYQTSNMARQMWMFAPTRDLLARTN